MTNQDDELLFLRVVGDAERTHGLFEVFVCGFLGAPDDTGHVRELQQSALVKNNKRSLCYQLLMINRPQMLKSDSRLDYIYLTCIRAG